jgi:hypothetical protein
VRRVSAGGYLHSFAKTGKTELSLCTYVLGPHRFGFRGNRWTSTRFADERRQKSKITSILWFALLLATGSCNWRPKRMEMKDYIDLAQRPFLLLWRLATLRCPQEGQDLFVETRKRKCQSVVPTRTSQPTCQPRKPTNRSKQKTSSGPVGAKSLLKRRAVRNLFLRLIFRSREEFYQRLRWINRAHA